MNRVRVFQNDKTVAVFRANELNVKSSYFFHKQSVTAEAVLKSFMFI